MKLYLPGFCLAVFALPICAQQPDPCAGSTGVALAQCQSDQVKLQRQQLEQQQQQLERQRQELDQQQQEIQEERERQNQLTEQQRELRQQIAGMQRQNELLREQLPQGKSAHPPIQGPATAAAKAQELRSWKADNPWFGSDYARTQFAVRYARKLQQERPDLVGRPFLDAIAVKVRDTFGAGK
jgi:small-conductance mechanosensitive channel